MFKRVQFWIGIAISLVCLVAIYMVIDVDQLADALRSADPAAILVMASGQIIFLLIRAWRWRVILGGEAGYLRLLHAQNIGYLVTSLLPFRLGDLVRCYLVGREPGISVGQALSTVVIERVIDMMVILVLFGTAAPLSPGIPSELATAGTLIGAATLIGFILLVLAARVRHQAIEFVERLMGRLRVSNIALWSNRVRSLLDGLSILTSWKRFVPVMALSVMLWATIVLAYWGGLKGFWTEATLPASVITLCAAAFGVAAPSSPGFVGVFHGSVMLGLSVSPATPEQATGFAIVYHAVSTYLVNVGLGLVGLWRSGQSLASVLGAISSVGDT